MSAPFTLPVEDDPFNFAKYADPYPNYRHVRETTPVYWSQLLGGWVLTRHADVKAALLDKRLPGFGELFRMLSYEEVGAAAMLSRAQMGICARRIVVSLPGSPNACRLALEKLLIPELPHLVREVNR